MDSGPIVTPGYWQKPEETKHAIRDGLLYTGDVGKMDEDGWFYLVDRKKDMIVASGTKKHPQTLPGRSPERLLAPILPEAFPFIAWTVRVSYGGKQSLVQVIKPAVGHDQHHISCLSLRQKICQQQIRIRKTMGLKLPLPQI